MGIRFVFVGIHLGLPANAADAPSYVKSPTEMVLCVLQYSGGSIKHALRIYAAFGPVLVYRFFEVVGFSRQPRDAVVYLAVLVLVVAATFLATDTLRVMEIFFLPVLLYASRFVVRVWHGLGWRYLAAALVTFQLLYSSVVYLHLRTCEGSWVLNLAAALLSALALLAAVGAFVVHLRTGGAFCREGHRVFAPTTSASSEGCRLDKPGFERPFVTVRRCGGSRRSRRAQESRMAGPAPALGEMAPADTG